MEAYGIPKIKVIGVGGAGCNAVNRMYQDGFAQGVEVYAINTDVQHLNMLQVPNKIHIGEKVTRGLGAGSDPQIGERAAEEDIDKIKEALKDADMAFIAVGLGGGTGTGAAPVIAKTAKDMGILTVAVATLPFSFEKNKRQEIALKGLEKLKENVDTYIIIHNDKLKSLGKLPVWNVFKEVDKVLSIAVRSVTNIITDPLEINPDFADIKTIMENGGLALIGLGEGEGENKVEKAVEKAISNPLLEGGSIEGARRLLITLWVGESVEFEDLEKAMNLITEKAGREPLIIFGATKEEGKDDYMRISIIATDFDKEAAKEQEEGIFRVIKRETSLSQKTAEEEVSINPVEPEEIPAYLRRRRKI